MGVWLTVVMVGIFGTMAADVLHVAFDVPYVASALLYAVALSAVFVTWHRVEGTLSVHEIDTPRREAFYWAAVVTTFALGTAVGDLTAITLNLGYLTSAILYAAVIAVIALAYWRGHLGPTLAFWAAYVMTARSARRSPTGSESRRPRAASASAQEGPASSSAR